VGEYLHVHLCVFYVFALMYIYRYTDIYIYIYVCIGMILVGGAIAFTTPGHNY